MAAPTGLLFMDSFDHYDPSSGNAMGSKWTIPGGTAVTPGRDGTGQSLLLGNPPPKWTSGFVYPTICMEIAYKTTGFSNNFLFQCTNVAQGGLGNNGLFGVGDGRLQVGDAFGTRVILTGFVMSLNTWYVVGMLLSMTGLNAWAYDVRINGSSIGAGTLANATGPLGAQFGFAALEIGGAGAAVSTVDDFTITDGEFLGDRNISPIYTDAPGDSTQWTPSPVQANWINVSEHPPDNFATYNQANAIANQDLYNMQDVGLTRQILGIQGLTLPSKIAAGVASFSSSVKTNATLIQEPEFFPSFGSFGPYQRVARRKNPVTGLDFTPAEINAIQRGALRIS